MIIVIYDQETLGVISVVEDASNVEEVDGGIRWEGGSLMGLKKPYVILPKGTDVGDTLTPEMVAAGVTQTKPSAEDQLKAENKALSDRADFLEEVLTEMIFSIYQ